jgi:hypothetical protein
MPVRATPDPNYKTRARVLRTRMGTGAFNWHQHPPEY